MGSFPRALGLTAFWIAIAASGCVTYKTRAQAAHDAAAARAEPEQPPPAPRGCPARR
jgi:hypothetical protein